VRYDHRRGAWLLWDAHRWVLDTDGAVVRLALTFARDWQRTLIEIQDREQREAQFKAAIRLERRDALHSMLALARNLHPITDAGERWDADPWLMGVVNGVVDLRTGRLRPGRRDDRITMSTAVPFEPDQPCPRWERFVAEIFAADAAQIDYVQQAAGYSVTGDTSEQCLFLQDGTGANGKGTFSNTLAETLGAYAYTMPFSTIELNQRSAIPNDVAALVSRRFVTASETNDGTRLNESRVKALTGCDPITARFLHGEFFTFRPVAKFWLAVNHRPIVRDDSFGFWRRMRVIPFAQRFEVDRTLAPALHEERSGILAWAIRGALAWQTHGLRPPASVLTATQGYQTDSDPLGAFLAEACEVEPASQVGAQALYDHYREWAVRHGLSDKERLGAVAFGRKASERFTRSHTMAGKVYLGVAKAR
jgi:putative DNA primase/helicase